MTATGHYRGFTGAIRRRFQGRITAGMLGAAGAMLPRAALADGNYQGYGHMWSGDYGWWMWTGPLMMLAFWVAVIVLVVLAVRWITDRGDEGRSASSGDKALEILKERLARGEIEPEEYERRRKVLED